MDASFDTSKIAYGNRPFDYKPPPFSIQAAHWIGMLFIAASFFHFITAVWVYANFGLTQFSVVTAAAIAGLILRGALPPVAAPFGPGRFRPAADRLRGHS